MAKKNVIVTKVNKYRWEQAQKFETEFAERTNDSGDDWNGWWKKKFDNYKLLNKKTFPRVLEVGCGPHTNLRLILPLIDTQEIYLEDPLISSYLAFNSGKVIEKKGLFGKSETVIDGTVNNLGKLFENKNYRVDLSSAVLEELPYRDGLVDLVICINVLDHVSDLDKCMSEISRVLSKNGVLIMGQDLSNKEDYKLAPESWEDIGHPIKVDEDTMNSYTKNYSRLFYKILPRKEGRNPAAHYGTYLLIGKKK